MDPLLLAALTIATAALARVQITATGDQVARVAGWIVRQLSSATASGWEHMEGRDHNSLFRTYFPIDAEVVFRPGAEHSRHPNQVHPDNQEAARRLLDLFDQNGCDLVGTVQYNGKHSPDHRCSLGSPTSTAEAYSLMGRRLGNCIATPAGEPPFSLKYVFGLPGERTARRYVGGELDNRPLTTLFDDSGKQPVQAQRGGKGWLTKDYLLVTRVPNLFVQENARGSWDYDYLSIAGITGVGTKAGASVFADKHMLAKIDRRLHGARYYQALLGVEVQHDELARSSEPSQELELLDAVPVELDDERIRGWLKRAMGTDPHSWGIRDIRA